MQNILKDPLVIAAFERRAEDISRSLPSKEELEDITFSEAFEKKMEKLLRVQKRFYFYYVNTVGKRVACILLVLFIALTSTAFGVKAIREPLIRFIIETFEKFTHVTAYTDDPVDIRDVPFEKMPLPLVPEGYELEKEELYSRHYCETYINPEGLSILYMQKINDGASIKEDTESTDYETVDILGQEGILYQNKDVNRIVFHSDLYLFSISGPVERDELIQMAEALLAET